MLNVVDIPNVEHMEIGNTSAEGASQVLPMLLLSGCLNAIFRGPITCTSVGTES